MKIELQSMQITNFKGIKSMHINFSKRTNIFADNGLGKTTIFDAWLWLLFSKDSTNRDDTNFSIKTLDAFGNEIGKLDHEVEAVINVNGDTLVLKKTYRENWVKKRGEEKATLKGHETVYEWNSVPLKMSEYNARINELIPEAKFKLVTNSNYFNSLKWQERRSILVDMAGEITNEEVAGTDNELCALVLDLEKYRDLDDMKKQISATKRKLKEELEYIPARIDEVTRSIAGLPTDFSDVEAQIAKRKQDLSSVENKLMDIVTAQKDHNQLCTQKLNDAQALRVRKMKISAEIDGEMRFALNEMRAEQVAKQASLDRANQQLKSLIEQEKFLTTRRDAYVRKQAELRDEWNKISSTFLELKELVINEAEFCCPTCKRQFDAADIDQKKLELHANHEKNNADELAKFNQRKSLRLSEINQEGVNLGDNVKDLNSQINHIINEKARLQAEIIVEEKNVSDLKADYDLKAAAIIPEINDAIQNNPLIKKIDQEIALLENEANAALILEGEADLKSQKEELNSILIDLNKKLSLKSQVDAANQRISELMANESAKAMELATVERKEFLIDKFFKLKMSRVEDKVNSLFGYVKFRMFENTIDGTEYPACVTLIDGVPYADANNAARINAGLDIIKTLSQFYGVMAPVFVDNAESVTSLINMPTQVVRLVVSKEDSVLRVENKELEFAH